jgi:hypothetical protein
MGSTFATTMALMKHWPSRGFQIRTPSCESLCQLPTSCWPSLCWAAFGTAAGSYRLDPAWLAKIGFIRPRQAIRSAQVTGAGRIGKNLRRQAGTADLLKKRPRADPGRERNVT